ncbi:glycosyltransferase family 9 protein [Poseidonibacter lekithochrous]|uniref:glycosyltransferase family 9 protein n=1 Tax=Poseidonibacter lekithochrous TaxID=1904463 RepID=UPI000D34992C|nr:glycosyltransferase family 9 protein [Poseidonibacter lekithochrous]
MIDLNNKKILLVRNDNVGDLICTTPIFEALRTKYPSVQMDVVVNSYNYEGIDQNPNIDNIYCYTKPKHKKNISDKLKAAFGKLKILIDINRMKYDVVVVLRSDYSKSAELFSTISQAKYKVGVKSPNLNDKFNIHVPVDNMKHEVEFCFDCLSKFDVQLSNENTFFYVPKKLVKNYEKYKKFTLVHISSRRKANKFDKEKFIKLINNMKNRNILISAEPDDFESAIYIEQNTHAKFIKTKSLLDLSGLISNVELLITLDGGAMHVGPAVKTKTLSISGETNMNKWYPWGYKDLVIQAKSKFANDIKIENILNKIEEC